MEPDFDSITTQIQRRLESLVVQTLDGSSSSASLLDSSTVAEHIPTQEVRELFQSQLADSCSEDTLEQLIQSSHQIIHKAVLHPRHTWSKPIWVLRVYSLRRLLLKNIIIICQQTDSKTIKINCF